MSGVKKTILERMLQKDGDRYDLRFLADANEPNPGGFKAKEWLTKFDPTANADDVITNTAMMAARTPYSERSLVNSVMPIACHCLGPIKITTVTSIDAGVSRYHAAQIAKMRRGGFQQSYYEVGSSPLHPDGSEPVEAETSSLEQSVRTLELGSTSFPQRSTPPTAAKIDVFKPLSRWPSGVSSGSVC